VNSWFKNLQGDNENDNKSPRRAIVADGIISSSNDGIASPTQRLFNRGYAVTSYASQGKTVDTVLFADAANRAATNCNQWYVAISRGRRRVVVFTSDKAELRTNIEQTGDRGLAREMKSGFTAQAGLPEWSHRAMVMANQVRRHEAVMHWTSNHAPDHKISL